MPSVMSVSVHCMRLADSYDTLTEDKLRYRLAQSHTHPIRSIWSPHGYQLRHRFLVPPLNQSPLIQEILLAGRRKLHLLLQQPSILLRVVNSQSLGNIRNLRSLHTAPPSPFIRMLYPQFLFPSVVFLTPPFLFLHLLQYFLELRFLHCLICYQLTDFGADITPPSLHVVFIHTVRASPSVTITPSLFINTEIDKIFHKTKLYC